MIDTTKYPIPVFYLGKQVGLQYENHSMIFTDKAAEKEIFCTGQKIYISSRAKGIVKDNQIESGETFEIDIL